MNKKKAIILILLTIILLTGMFTPAQAKTDIPELAFTDVKMNESVCIITNKMPANVDLIAYMGELDTKGENGIVVGKMNTGKGGSFSAILPIPQELSGRQFIVVRLEAPKAWYTYNTFVNDPNGSTPVASVKPSDMPKVTTTATVTETIVNGKKYKGFPVFAIKSVEAGKSVTIITDNFPVNMDFVAMIGKVGKNGEDGTAAGKFNSGEGGAFEATFLIPENVAGLNQLAIRLVAPNRYYAYNWFDNSASVAGAESSEVTVTTEASATPESAEAAATPTATGEKAFEPKPGGPRIEISSVTAGKSVKIKGSNLRPNLEYVIKMNAFGSDSQKEAAKFTSDNSGKHEMEVPIPETLAKLNIISIVMESSKDYAFNFFYNVSSAE